MQFDLLELNQFCNIGRTTKKEEENVKSMSMWNAVG